MQTRLRKEDDCESENVVYSKYPLEIEARGGGNEKTSELEIHDFAVSWGAMNIAIDCDGDDNIYASIEKS